MGGTSDIPELKKRATIDRKTSRIAFTTLVVKAAKRPQTVITTHSEPFASHIERLGGVKRITLEKIDGETTVKPEDED